MKAIHIILPVCLFFLSGCSLVQGMTAVDDCRDECRQQGYDDGACRSLSLDAPAGFEPGSACLVDESEACSQNGQCRCYCLPQDTASLPEGVLTVAEALQKPQQDEVTVYGVVYELGERYCPCFRLSSGGADVEAWFTAGVDGDSLSLDMAGIHNGDRVIVSGIRTSPATLYVSNIRKYEAD